MLRFAVAYLHAWKGQSEKRAFHRIASLYDESVINYEIEQKKKKKKVTNFLFS